MKTTGGATKTWLARSLLVGVLVFVVMFLLRRYVYPSFPALDGPLLGALVAGAVGGVVAWLVLRRWGS